MVMEGSENTDRKEIRRPMNAFLIFCKRHRRMVREKNSHLDNRSVTRILGELWANLTEEEKTVYTDLAKQYKEAFMKANPDYKWHNPEKVHPVLGRPVVVKSPTLKRKICGEVTGNDSIVPGKLADPIHMGGLNLLLMAGENSFGNKDHGQSHEGGLLQTTQTPKGSLQTIEESVSSSVQDGLEENHSLCVKEMDKSSGYPGYSLKHGSDVSNTALLQLAEMCSSQLEGCTGQEESKMSTLTSESPQWRSSGQLPVSVNKSSTLQQEVSSPCYTEQGCDKASDKLTTKDGNSKGPIVVKSDCSKSTTTTRNTNQLLYNLIVENPDTPKPAPVDNNNDKIKGTNKTEEDPLLSCNKVIVDHIIDSLFTKDKGKPINMMTIEETFGQCCDPAQVKAIIKEKLKKINVTQNFEECMTQIIIDACAAQILGDSKDTNILVDKNAKTSPKNNSLMSQLLQTGSYVSPVKKAACVKKELTGPELKSDEGNAMLVKVEQVNNDKSFEAKMRLPKKRPYTESLPNSTISKSSSGRPTTISPVCTLSPNRPTSTTVSHLSPVADRSSYFCKSSGESPSTDTESSFQATRKSKRRNRGQRYLELINEGIIQPSKERLAAMRTESISSIDDSPSDEDWRQEAEEDLNKSESRPVREKDTTAASPTSKEAELPRYKSGDFDLEAHIASLPVCSMDSLNRKKRRSNSNSSKTISEKSLEKGSGEELLTLYRPPHVHLQPSPGTLTGSQRRKARKHSITHLIEVHSPEEITTQMSTSESEADALDKSSVEMITSEVEMNENILDSVNSVLTDEVFTVPASPKLAENKERVKKSLKHNRKEKPVQTFDVYEFSEESDTLLPQPLSISQSPQKKMNMFGKRDFKPYQKIEPKTKSNTTPECGTQGYVDFGQINISQRTNCSSEECEKGGNLTANLTTPELPGGVHQTDDPVVTSTAVNCRSVKPASPFTSESSGQASVQYVVRDTKPGVDDINTICSNTTIQNAFTMASVHS